MRTLITALALVLAISVPSFAQTTVPSPIPPTTRIAFDHDGLNTTGYKLKVDTGEPTIVATTPLAGSPGSLTIAFPALTPGVHELTVSAFNADGEAASDIFTVRVTVVPAKPLNLRLAAGLQTAAPNGTQQ
jgi:hypothetical protein